MKGRSRNILVFGLLFGYIFFQFLWWEILLVRQNGTIINEKQKLLELTSVNADQLKKDVEALHHKKKMQTVMIVSEGTVFLLLLLFGIYRIKKAQDKESALNNQQKNFFLSITHELKTPIAATKLQLQTLQRQKLDEASRTDLVARALLETERLNMLIDNVLLASSLETGQIIFKKEKQNLGQVIQTIVDRYYKNEVQKEELNLNVVENVFVEIDQHAFPSILTNLIDNALKYSPVKKEISVELRKENEWAVLSVKDQGLGVGQQDKEKIFNKFFRVGNEETRTSKGTGLGLYIVNYIVAMHGTKIKVKDNTPKGSIFEIRFHAV